MKKITTQKKMIEVEVPVLENIEGQGLSKLLGKKVILFCMNYFYAGVLVGVNENDVILENAGIVYETGAFTASSFKDFQRLPGNEWGVRINTIESYGEVTVAL